MDLLQTKFYMPPPRPNLVPRARLWARLDDGLEQGQPLTLVCAPAGYGKTTLIAAWLQQQEPPPVPGRRLAWLSLDEGDDDPARFLPYFMAALERCGVTWDAPAAQLAQGGPLPAAPQAATLLLNALSRGDDQPLLLVLDDYHKIRAPLIHELLAFWIEHAPPFAQLLLLTREDPPLPLPRWRAQARLTEIRAGHLQFSSAETAAFLNQTMALDLPQEAVLALEQRTEGWIAGLQLAAAALRAAQSTPDGADSAAFIAEFSGSHHYVIDYLVEEVLRRQPPHVRDFLQQTAVLNSLCAPLGDALTGRDDSQAILSDLERANLFLVPLDNQQLWYRYHHLLADSLRAGLDRARQATLHARAAAWYAAAQQPAPAMHHARAADDQELAADILQQVIQNAPAWSRGEVGQLTGWLEALPGPLLHARPALSLHASRAFYLAGDLDRAAQMLAQAEQGLAGRPAADTEGLRALAAVYRGAIAALRGTDLAQTAAAMRDLLAGSAPLDRHTLARAADTLGLALELRGDLAGAERAYLRAADLAAAAGVDYLAINGRCEAALVQISAGRLAQAAQTCRQALAAAPDIPPAGLAWAILGEIAREQDDLHAAAAHLERGIALSQKGGISDDLRYSYLFLARLHRAQGDHAAALAAWGQADAIMQGYRVARLADLAAAQRARLDLAAGRPDPAAAWAQTYPFQADALGDYVREFEALTLARVHLAQSDFDAAAVLLTATLAAAGEGGRERARLEALILLALAYAGQGQPAQATAVLARALPPAAAAGFRRLFLDEGPPLAALLPAARAAAPAFVDDLLARFAAQAPEPAAGAAAVPSPLAEPLSEREEEVLALLVAGLSNDDIAAELVITTGTAKWHVHNIYQKLDVGNRAQAIARAHELRLV